MLLPACEPAEMTLIPSSTRTGVLGITRTTGVPAASRSSNQAVGTPAAAEITSRSAPTCGASSSSRAPMSCGLTARIRVSASLAASALETATTP